MCKGQILEPLVLNPRHVNFGQVSRTSSNLTKKIKISRGDGGPLKPKLISGENENFKVQLNELKAGEEYELEVTLATPFEGKVARTKLSLETGVEQAPTLDVPLYAMVRPRVEAVPRRFVVPANRAADWEESARLKWDDGGTHKIVEATVNDPDLKIRVDEEENGNQRVVVMVPTDYKATTTARTVTVKTDDAQTPTLRIPIRFDTKKRTPPRRVKRPQRKAAAPQTRAKGAKDKASRLPTQPRSEPKEPQSTGG
jgi:hypothetical protein